MNTNTALQTTNGQADAEIIEPAETSTAIEPASYQGIAATAFAPESIDKLLAPIPDDDIEIRPDGLIYLPEIKYRRILSRAFGPGAWAIRPIEIRVDEAANMLFYTGALFVQGRFVAEAIGEQQFFATNGNMSWATAAESAKSNCLLRCCKDLSVASDLWDPTFIKKWVATHAVEVWVVNAKDGKKKKMWRKKKDARIDQYPWREDGGGAPQQQPQGDDWNMPSQAQGAPKAAAPQQDRAPQQRERQSYETKPTTNATIITFPQARRYKAIAVSKGWSDANIAVHLKRHGFGSHEEITRNAYDQMCRELEDGVTLETIRKEAK